MRVQVNISDIMVERIDKYAQMMGVSRSALCSMLIGQGIMGFDKAFDIMDGIATKLDEKALKGQMSITDVLGDSDV